MNLAESNLKQLDDIYSRAYKLKSKGLKVLFSDASGMENMLTAPWLSTRPGQTLYRVDLESVCISDIYVD